MVLWIDVVHQKNRVWSGPLTEHLPLNAFTQTYTSRLCHILPYTTDVWPIQYPCKETFQLVSLFPAEFRSDWCSSGLHNWSRGYSVFKHEIQVLHLPLHIAFTMYKSCAHTHFFAVPCSPCSVAYCGVGCVWITCNLVLQISSEIHIRFGVNYSNNFFYLSVLHQ
jgi:hypothetical protein